MAELDLRTMYQQISQMAQGSLQTLIPTNQTGAVTPVSVSAYLFAQNPMADQGAHWHVLEWDEHVTTVFPVYTPYQK